MLTLQATGDGSLTSFCPENGERYHNRNGAWEETEAIYIKPARFKERLALRDVLHIMDPFFGLGYISLGCIIEFFDTLKAENFDTHKTLHITAVENDPEILTHFGSICDQFDHILVPEIKKQVHYAMFSKEEGLVHKIYYQTQHESAPKIEALTVNIDLGSFNLNASIQFDFYLADIRQVLPHLVNQHQTVTPQPFHCIFHDPFSPKKMPELWTQTVFERYRELVSDPDGIVFTYSQSSAIRGGIENAGFILRKPIVDKYPKSGSCGLLDSIFENHEYLTCDLHKLSIKELYLLESRAGLSYVDNKVMNSSREEIVSTRQTKLQETTRMGSSEAIRRASALSDN